MKVLGLLFGLGIAFTSPSAFADDIEGTGLFIEPGIQYQMTSGSVDYPTGAPSIRNTTATTQGGGVVFRAGVHVWERMFIAADARYSFMKFNDNANNLSEDATSWDLAPTIGWQMADNGVRLYAGYIVTGNLDPKSARGYDFVLENGQGWRAGAGLKLESLSVNFEWQNIEYDKTVINSGYTAGGKINYNPTGIVASITFPIQFD